MGGEILESENPRLYAAWGRLQKLSCEHAARIYLARYKPGNRYHKDRYGKYIPETIRENVEILGRGDEEEIKARVLWYLTYYPDLFGEIFN